MTHNDRYATVVLQPNRVLCYMLSGPYANRANIIDLNGTLEINSVRDGDATDYRCTVRRINFTSPEVYIVALKVDTSGKYTFLVFNVHICY